MPDSPTALALRPLFSPRAVAVLGASRRRGTVGGELFHNVRITFGGPVYPVNPSAADVQGVRAYARILDTPGDVDLAVIAVPSNAVEAAVDDCLSKGVRALIVISAGFGETGEDGKAREARLRDRVRAAGVRLVGPNCLGVVNTDPAVGFNATFSPAHPSRGPVAFASQSGALGLAVLDATRALNLGISSFVSIGNRIDVSANDLMEYWAEDDRTSVILLYLESFGNPRRFGTIARRVGRRKPVVALKSGRSPVGARAALSHTGALAAADVMVDALFADAGVVRVATLEELFDVGAVLARQPLPTGPNVAIVSNAGGPGILAADACVANGLSVPPLQATTQDALRAFLPAGANVANPLDMIATATPQHYRDAMRLVLADPGIDSVLVIFTPGLLTSAAESAAAVAEAAAGAAKPILATRFGAADVSTAIEPVPSFAFPESAVRALARAVAYRRWRDAPLEAPALPAAMRLEAARAVVARAAGPTPTWLGLADVEALLVACGIGLAPTRGVSTWPEARAHAATLGYPVVLKGAGPTIVHKTEARAVFTDLTDEADLEAAFRMLSGRADVTSFVLQPMVTGGVEMLVGATVDPTFGPAVVCGMGGTLVELIGNTSCRLAPLSPRGAADMVNALKGAPRLRGFRGAAPCAEGALHDVLLRVSALVTACPHVLELDLNPVLVTTDAAIVLDARVRVGTPSLPTPPPASEPQTTWAPAPPSSSLP